MPSSRLREEVLEPATEELALSDSPVTREKFATFWTNFGRVFKEEPRRGFAPTKEPCLPPDLLCLHAQCRRPAETMSMAVRFTHGNMAGKDLLRHRG